MRVRGSLKSSRSSIHNILETPKSKSVLQRLSPSLYSNEFSPDVRNFKIKELSENESSDLSQSRTSPIPASNIKLEGNFS